MCNLSWSHRMGGLRRRAAAWATRPLGGVPRRARHRLRALLPILGALVAAYLLLPVRLAVVVGSSMSPSLRSGSVVAVWRTYYTRHAIRRGDVIAFRHGREVHVKRVIALGGDRLWEVHYRDDPGSVFLVNEQRMAWVRQHLARWRDPPFVMQVRVPAGTLYVLGDAGNASQDSRHYGPVPQKDVLGRIFLDEVESIAARRALQSAAI